MLGQPWSDPVYTNTAMLVISAIFVVAVILFPFRKKQPAVMASWASIKSWIFAAPLFFFAVGLPDPWPLVGITAVAIFCAKEFFQITGMYHRSFFVWLVYFGIIGQALCIYYEHPVLYDRMPMIMTALIMMVPLVRNNYKFMVQYTALSVFNFIFMGWGILHMGRILLLPEGHLHLIYVIVLAEAADNIALGAGRVVGRTKILDKISGRRTVEGAIVSIGFTLWIAYALRNIFTNEAENFWLVAGTVAYVSGSLGDLALAVIRRDLGVKDQGAFIWGRGGILDLLDRMIFVAPIYWYALKWLHEGTL